MTLKRFSRVKNSNLKTIGPVFYKSYLFLPVRNTCLIIGIGGKGDTMTALEIIKSLKEGKYWSIACSRYEECYWYKDGQFHGSMENGYSDPKDRVYSEDRVRGDFARALMNKEDYDVWQGI